MILEGKRVKLVPLTDIEYFLDLADADNKGLYPRDSLANVIKNYGVEFWETHQNGKRMGVIGYFKFGEIYFVEGVRDRSVPNVGVTTSIEVTEMVIARIRLLTNRVYTCARKDSKAINIICKKLGFVEIDKLDYMGSVKEDLNWYKLEV